MGEPEDIIVSEKTTATTKLKNLCEGQREVKVIETESSRVLPTKKLLCMFLAVRLAFNSGAISPAHEDGVGAGDGRREFRERQLELGSIGGQCGNPIQWKLPKIYENDLSEDS